MATCSVADSLDRGELGLEPDQIVCGQAGDDRVARLALDAVLGQQLAVEVGVAEPDHGAVEAGGVQRRLQHLDDLGRARRRRHSDQLDPGLDELAHLAALGTHRPVGTRQVAEAQRLLGSGQAAGGEPGDRHRHVRAQRQQLAVSSKKR